MSIGIGTQVKRGGLALTIAMLALASFACASASASFGIADTELAFEEKDGSPLTQAGAHPYLMTTGVNFNSIITDGEGRIAPDEATNDLITELLPRAFVRPVRSDALLDTTLGVIAVDTSSRKNAESVVSEIRRALGSFPALPVNAEVAPRAILTGWYRIDPETPDA